MFSCISNDFVRTALYVQLFSVMYLDFLYTANFCDGSKMHFIFKILLRFCPIIFSYVFLLHLFKISELLFSYIELPQKQNHFSKSSNVLMLFF